MIRDQVARGLSGIKFRTEDRDRVAEIMTQVILDMTEKTVKDVQARKVARFAKDAPQPEPDPFSRQDDQP